MVTNTGVLYGDTETYKTWNLGLLARHIFAVTKKPVRYITADGGGFRPIQSLVDAEIIIPLMVANDPKRIAVLQSIVEGYWPQTIKEYSRVGDTFLKPSTVSGLAGGYIFEGVTSIAESIHKLFEGIVTGMKPAFGQTIKADFKDEKNVAIPNVTIGGYSQDSYGVVQNIVHKLINYSWTLPVKYVWWSGHEALAEDEFTNKTVRGVAMVGKAATPRLGKHLGSVIHAYRTKTLANDKKVKTNEVRYYFQTHPDNTIRDAFWPAKPRIPGDQMEALLKVFPEGYFLPEYNGGLDLYIRTEEELLSKGSEEAKAWKKGILDGTLKY
jgi:hypothetical protein